MKPLPLDKLTRTTVERLFRDLIQGSNFRLNKLWKKREAAYAKWHTKMTKIKQVAIEIQRKYQARGLTPTVLKELNELVDEVNRS